MLNKIKNILLRNNKEEDISEEIFKEEEKKIQSCADCPIKKVCEDRNNRMDICEFASYIPTIEGNKETILIIDDNYGVVSFLEDDIEFYREEKVIDDNIQVLSIPGNNAAFVLELIMKKVKSINIKYAIIDLTLGGSRQTKFGNIKYTGVDVFKMIYENNKDIKYVFYTGNKLNPYIKSNETLMKEYKDITKRDIKENVLFKTSIDMDSRRTYISKKLFNKEI